MKLLKKLNKYEQNLFKKDTMSVKLNCLNGFVKDLKLNKDYVFISYHDFLEFSWKKCL